MKTIDKIELNSNQKKALNELNKKLKSNFDIVETIIFGSAARGEMDSESDLDLLIVTAKILDRTTRHQITDIVCEINLKYDTNLSTLVVDKKSWEEGIYSILPIHDEILKEGVLL
jgi:predicted nucleotidyltransferase